MAFLLSRDEANLESLIYLRRRAESWKAYQHHLSSYAKRLPPGALAFARASWHYDTSDSRCPHDAWLVSVHIDEGPETAPVHERSIDIVVRLLGAQHDGHLELSYRNVLAYALDMPRLGSRSRPTGNSHGDWLVDEVRSEGHRGRAVHEVEWASGTTWMIDCCEIEVVWLPLDGGEPVLLTAGEPVAAPPIRAR